MTRDGLLFAYKTTAPACSPSSWPRFHHDLANSGYYDRDAVDPGAPTSVTHTGGALVFKAPGDDLLCGKADRYEVVESNAPLTGATFKQGLPIPMTAKPKAPGQQETILLGGKLQRYLLIRAVDEQGNVGPAVRVDTKPGGNPICVDTKPPQTSIQAGSLANRPGGLTIRGQTVDNGCRDPNVAKKKNAIAEVVTVAKREGNGNCRYLQSNHAFSAKRRCSKPILLRAKGAYTLKKHAFDWNLATGTKFGPGSYEVTALGIDQSGNVEHGRTKKNDRSFTVKKSRRRSSAQR
jgi:hypothetical protein